MEKFYLILTMVVFFGGYFAIYFLVKGHKITESVSASFYSWDHTDAKPWTDRFFFRIMIAGISIPWFFLVPYWSGWLAGSLVFLIGQAAHYRQKAPYILTMHMIGSFAGILMAMISIGLYFGHVHFAIYPGWKEISITWENLWYFTFLIAGLVGSAAIKFDWIKKMPAVIRENKTWWIEIYFFILAVIGASIGSWLS